MNSGKDELVLRGHDKVRVLHPLRPRSAHVEFRVTSAFDGPLSGFPALNQQIAEVVAEQDADHWVAALDKVGVPCAAVNSVPEVLAHPQTSALGMLLDGGDPKLGLVASPLRFDGVRPGLRGTAPATPTSDVRVIP